MQTIAVSIRRKDATKGSDVGFYGNSVEVPTSGENKGKEVPIILAENKLVPSTDQGPEVWLNEFIENCGGVQNLQAITERIFGNEVQRKMRQAFVNLKDDAESTPEKRDELVKKAIKNGETFTFADVISEGISAKSALDELKNDEMTKLMETDPQEFIRRTMAILAKTK